MDPFRFEMLYRTPGNPTTVNRVQQPAAKNGYVLFIDELEASLHPHLTKFLVNLFHNPDQNENNGQLIFTTHDTNLLNLLRRDQVWFTEKNS
jgi:AAA15 family ATPase/GTPase